MAMTTSWERDKTPVARVASLTLVARSYTLRCDAKQAESCFEEFRRSMSRVEVMRLGAFLPRPFVKGVQPSYLETLDPQGVPVVSTLAIQGLRIVTGACRHISQEDFDGLSDERKLRRDDVLLTMDGGTSIGKPVLFDLDEEHTVDSHVCILRPEGIGPLALVYLLASPIGQLQFQQAESGASGQTAVTEEDVRRFVFPSSDVDRLEDLVKGLHEERRAVQKEREALDERERGAWMRFNEALLEGAGKTGK